MMIKILFQNSNMISYSIHETDKVDLDIDLRSIYTDGSTDELFGQYLKSVPIQYPEEFSVISIYELRQAIELTPYIIFMLIFLCFTLLIYTSNTDKTAVVWVILTNMPLLILMPLVNVPVPA